MDSGWSPVGNERSSRRNRQTSGGRAQPDRSHFRGTMSALLSALLKPYGFHVTVEEQLIAFTASSARDYLDPGISRSSARGRGTRRVLERMGKADELYDRMLEILQNGNKDADRFCVTSRYVIAVARRSSTRAVTVAAAGSLRCPDCSLIAHCWRAWNIRSGGVTERRLRRFRSKAGRTSSSVRDEDESWG